MHRSLYLGTPHIKVDLLGIICQGCIILMVAARVFHINLFLICVTLQCVLIFEPYHWPMSTEAFHLMLGGQCKWYLLDFSSLDGTVCYTVSATWECLEHPACVTKYIVALPCWRISLIWHTKVYLKSDWSINTYIQADHIITQSPPFGIKVMSKFKVLSKCERGMIKKRISA